jgi:hypothetical protein
MRYGGKSSLILPINLLCILFGSFGFLTMGISNMLQDCNNKWEDIIPGEQCAGQDPVDIPQN